MTLTSANIKQISDKREKWGQSNHTGMIKAFLILIMVLLVIGPGLVWWFAWRPIPSPDGTAEIRALAGPVVVSFDARDVPYIEANGEDDAYAAQGYVVARERMFQMEMMRLAAEGKMASVFGISALPSDRLMRTLGFERLAQQELKSLSAPARAALEAYCRGVNSYLNGYGDRLPLEYVLLGIKPAPWRPVDSLAVSKYLAYELDESWKLDELRWRVTSKTGDQLAADLFKDDYAASLWAPKTAAVSAKPAASSIISEQTAKRLASIASLAPFRHAPLTRGSSAWVLAPGLSSSGRVIMSADKHSGFSLPGDWYLCSMKVKGSRMAGACIPGIPGIFVGRNDDLCWSSSLLRADVQDLFVEHFDDEHSVKYQSGKDKLDATELREVIPVRFGQSVEHKVTTTKHGPVLLRDKESAVALSWTGFDTSKPMIESLYRMNHARSRDELRQALGTWGAAPQLFVWGDRAGNMGAQAAGTVPVRSAGGQGTTMAEGWTGKGEWTSALAYGDLPAQFVPAGSVLPGGEVCVAAGQRLSSKQLIGHQWAAPYRANRIFLALPKQKTGTKFSLADNAALQNDEFNMLSRLMSDELKKATEKTQSIDDQQQQSLALMRSWDGQLRANSPNASVFESALVTMIRRLVEPKLGKELTKDYLERWPQWSTFVERYLREKPAQWLPPEERTFETFMITTFAKANTRLKLFFQTDKVSDWQWQRIHQVVFTHPITAHISWLGGVFNQTGPGVGGDGDTVDSCDVSPASISGPFLSKSGPVMRILVDMADGEKFYADSAPGQSGHLFSAHRSDQVSSWAHGDALPIAFSDARVGTQARSKLYISSGGR